MVEAVSVVILVTGKIDNLHRKFMGRMFTVDTVFCSYETDKCGG